MTPIGCCECSMVGTYGASIESIFRCSNCGNLFSPGHDFVGNPGEVWAVDVSGILGWVMDPVVSLRGMYAAMVETATSPAGSVEEKWARQDFTERVAEFRGACEVLPVPADQRNVARAVIEAMAKA